MITTHKSPKPEEIERKWILVDASDVVLGRLSTSVAEILLGKHKPYFSPQWDMGDNVIVINAEKVAVTGNKEEDKKYYRHTGYPGGIRNNSVAEVRAKYPEELIKRSVRGMLPKNRMLDTFLSKLYVYAGENHPHEGQKPEILKIS